jgi:hypothetical protein
MNTKFSINNATILKIIVIWNLISKNLTKTYIQLGIE